MTPVILLLSAPYEIFYSFATGFPLPLRMDNDAMILLAKIELRLFDKFAYPWGYDSLFAKVAAVFWACAILYFLFRFVVLISQKMGLINDPGYKFEKYGDKYFGVPLLIIFGLLVVMVLASFEYRDGSEGKVYDDMSSQVADPEIE